MNETMHVKFLKHHLAPNKYSINISSYYHSDYYKALRLGSPLLLNILGYLQLFYYKNAVLNLHPFQQSVWTASSTLEDSNMRESMLALDGPGWLVLGRNQEMHDDDVQRAWPGSVRLPRDGRRQVRQVRFRNQSAEELTFEMSWGSL